MAKVKIAGHILSVAFNRCMCYSFPINWVILHWDITNSSLSLWIKIHLFLLVSKHQLKLLRKSCAAYRYLWNRVDHVTMLYLQKWKFIFHANQICMIAMIWGLGKGNTQNVHIAHDLLRLIMASWLGNVFAKLAYVKIIYRCLAQEHRLIAYKIRNTVLLKHCLLRLHMRIKAMVFIDMFSGSMIQPKYGFIR